MKDRQRFYSKGHGLDDQAVSRIIQKAIDIEKQLGNVSRITFVAHGLQNDGWLERQYGNDAGKKLRKGAKLPNSSVVAKFESLKTFRQLDNEIVITLGLDSEEILLIDDNYNISAILSIQWMENSAEKWAKITNATNVDDNNQALSYEDPDCVVIKALENLTKSINMSTGLSNSSDDKLAKTYLRALNKYNYPLPESEIESYLIKQLNWDKDNANELLLIINKINNGRSFQGGDKTGLQNYIKRWELTCKDQK